MSGGFDFHVYLDNLVHLLHVKGRDFPVLILPIHIEAGTTIQDVTSTALNIQEIIDHPAVMTGFEPRMIGTRSIVTGNILQIFATVTDVTWHVKERGFWEKLFYFLTELSRVRTFTKERLEANACAYYALDGTMITLLAFSRDMVVYGATSKFTMRIDQPLITVQIEEKKE